MKCGETGSLPAAHSRDPPVPCDNAAMRIAAPTEPLAHDDETIEQALADAVIPALLPALATITGDLSLLRDDLAPDVTQLFDPNAGLMPRQLGEARALALEALIRFRDDGGEPVPPPDDETLSAIVGWIVGDDVDVAEYLPMCREELDLSNEDGRAPRWKKDGVAPDTDFTVAIVGAGMSGLAAAYRLRQAGIAFTVFEKNQDVGGTWLENTYPGCRVDVPNHLYSYSFAQSDEWPHHFSTQETLLDYFRRCADEFGLREHIRFDTEVESAHWDDDEAKWVVCLHTPEGEEVVEVDAVVSAVGQLNRPKYPDIPGREEFAGEAFHSARWDHDVDLSGKRVGVVGNAASAAQFIPIVAEEAGHLTVFQRTPNWFVPTFEYHEEVPEGLRWLFRHVPTYSNWYRFWQFWRMADGLLPTTEVDPDWENQPQSVSESNDLIRMMLTEYLRAMFADDPDLFEKVVPDYPPAAKRIIRDNGVWPQTLMRDDVDLVTDSIERITAQGIVTADGTEHEFDVIIYGTGFHASEFLTPMKVTGRGGVDLHEHWDGSARAYLGITVPEFPNLFLLYGPNTNIVINGSIIFFSECEVHYVVECVRMLLEQGKAALAPRKDRHVEYNRRIDEGNAGRAWGASTVNTWYKNAEGHVTQNWPFTLLEYWQQTQAPDPDDYELIARP